jgi:hypothetical protein
MTTKKMREQIINYIEQVDERGLRLVYSLLREYSEPVTLSDQDEKELLKRRNSYLRGKSKTLTAAEAKIEFRKRIKKH